MSNQWITADGSEILFLRSLSLSLMFHRLDRNWLRCSISTDLRDLKCESYVFVPWKRMKIIISLPDNDAYIRQASLQSIDSQGLALVIADVFHVSGLYVPRECVQARTHTHRKLQYVVTAWKCAWCVRVRRTFVKINATSSKIVFPDARLLPTSENKSRVFFFFLRAKNIDRMARDHIVYADIGYRRCDESDSVFWRSNVIIGQSSTI